MPATRKAAPRDKNKVIRQLSLVACLMSAPPQGVSSRDIRRDVEAYDGMSDETFTRRFHADRDDLKRLGIEISSRKDSDGFSEVSFYRLPPENYFLPPVEFTREELAALHTCLCLLDGQFAYSRPLRLALQSLALGTGNPLDDPVTAHINVNLLTSGFDAAIAGRLDRMENAVLKRKTIIFDYHALSRDRAETHTVDPYRTMFTRGDWYMVGHSHERGALRVFKLRRIQGRVRNASKEGFDFTVPDDFEASDHLSLEPWQLGAVAGTAAIAFSPQRGWWAEQNLGHCGRVEMNADGSAVFYTDYSDGELLCSLVLGLWRHARLEKPPELREQLRSLAERVRDLHTAAPPATAARMEEDATAASGAAAAADKPVPGVEPHRFSRLATTITYLMEKIGEAESARLPLPEVCRDLGYDSTAELEQDMELLQMVNVGGGGGYIIDAAVKGHYLRVGYWPDGDLLKRPPRLSPLEARAMLLAIDLIGHQTLSGHYPSLAAAREKIIRAAGGLGEDQVIPVGETEKEDFGKCRAINRGLNENRLVEIEYLSGGSESLERRTIEPYMVVKTKGRWYLVAYCRLREAMRTFQFEMIKNARLLDEHFEPREVDLEPYRNPRFPSGKSAAHAATVWFSPAVARWIQEQQPGVTMLKDGSITGEIPYFGEEWLVDEILKYGGEAVVLSPANIREKVAETAARLAAG